MAPEQEISKTIGEHLREGAVSLKASPSPLLDARILLKEATGFDDAELIAASNGRLSDRQASKFAALIARRARGEPVAYIVGKKEFWSLPFKVAPDVLIPRDDSECLVEAILARRGRDEALSMLDLGVGSGCLLCALLSEFPNGFGVGIDRSEKALRIARANAKALGFSERSVFAAGNWLTAIGGAFDIVIANPPYIAENERTGLAVDISGFEPGGALLAGADGMDEFRAILMELAAAPWLLKGDGLLVFEAGTEQVSRLRQMVKETLQPVDGEIIVDLKGRQRGVAADFRLIEKRD